LRDFERNWRFFNSDRACSRFHQTLRLTPAMEAGISGHIWTLDELVGLLVTPASEAA
jgi:hypothetical protein